MYRNLALMIHVFWLSPNMPVLFSQVILFTAILGAKANALHQRVAKSFPDALSLLLALLGLLVTDKNFHFVIGLQHT
jgi:hypothetical protein